MRVPPPKSLKLDRAALLQDLRDRLAERLPDYAPGAEIPPTDPGWILLEQAAWMVELLSEQLDRYPYNVIQQLVHLMGGALRPAHPSLGVVVVQPEAPGVVRQPRDRPSPYRFYTAQSETRDIIEFVPAEGAVVVRPGSIDSFAALEDGELYRAGGPEGDSGLGRQIAWAGAGRRSRVFDREEITWTLVANDAAALAKTLRAATEALEADRGLGWLALSVAADGDSRVVMTGRIDPARAFAQSAPGGLAPGGDLVGRWGRLMDSTWTPPVKIADHPGLPLRLRDTRPLPGDEEGTLLVPAVPAQFPVAELLERRAAPLPDAVVDAVWANLVGTDAKLAPLRPVVRRRIAPPPEVPEGEEEPAWVDAALRGDAWRALDNGRDRSFVHVALAPDGRGAGVLRVGLVPARGQRGLPTVEVLGVDADGGLGRAPLEIREAWTLPAPARGGGRGMDRVMALDITLADEHTGALIAADGQLVGAFLNPLMVANAPAIRDGRTVSLDRTVPTSISLLHQDVLTEAVVRQLLEGPVPEAAAEALRRLPLSWMDVDGQDPIVDFQGVSVDASAGELTLNAPDPSGEARTLRPGASVEIGWYRRTDGAHGDVEPGAVEYVGQSARQRPRLNAVTNPLGTWFGAAREQEADAIDRLFAPSGDTPVLPSDWERLVHRALGSRGRGWLVRCWSYAERALVSAGTWPLDGRDAEAMALRDALEDAGPETLLVVVGPKDELLPAEDLDWARQAVEQLVQQVRRRLPAIRGAVVTRFWPLSMRTEEDTAPPPLPCFDVNDMAGTLVDPTGREAAPPAREAVLLNAAVVRVRAEWS